MEAPREEPDMRLHIERSEASVLITTENNNEFVFRRDGAGGVEISSQPNHHTFSRSEMQTIYRAARRALYETEEV